MSEQSASVYELIGGAETLEALVNGLYDRIAKHPDLIPIFPEDLTETRKKQYMFLTQFFGGPRLYAETYGPPMMRARHLKFPITPKRASAWLSCMSGAMDDVGLSGDIRAFMYARLTQVAGHMVNTD